MFATPIGAVALYTGLNALLLFALALNVGLRRGAQNQLEPGAMGDAALTRAIRAHGNFTEYAPLALLLLLVLAWLNAPLSLIHGLGAAFLVGRIAHAFGMMKVTHPNPIRFAGNLLTGLVLVTGAGACFYFAI